MTDALAAQLTKTMSSNDVQGAAVQVCVPGYENATIVPGVFRTLRPAMPMTGELVWPLRSVTKSYTVTLILQLVDEGNQPGRHHRPVGWTGFPNGDQITLRRLSVMRQWGSGVHRAEVPGLPGRPEPEFTTGTHHVCDR